MARQPRHEPDSVRITTAPSNRDEERRGRQRRYVISMLIRTACFIGAVVVGPGWLRWVLVALAVFLPYVAVLLANIQTTRGDDFTLPPGVGRHELPGPEEHRRL